MDNKTGVVLIAALIITVSAMIAGFVYLQSEINNLKSSSTNPTPFVPIYTPEPTQASQLTIQPTPTSVSQYSSTIYTWYLKPGLMGNETWLKEVGSTTGANYDPSKTWSDNYIAFISSIWEVPESVKVNHITGLVGASFIVHLPVTVSYDSTTGYTKATYQYEDGIYHVIESTLPDIAIDGNWIKEDV